jgi:two-component system, OmpR family, response regulator
MKILLIEDDPTLSENIRAELLDNGYQAEVAHDGLMGEKMLKKNYFDLIILDINLPHKNGYQLCKEFRKYNTKTPVLLLTAFSEIEDKLEGFEAGADDYLTKPFYSKELLARVKVLLKRSTVSATSPESNSTKISIKDLVIDTEKKQVFRAGQLIDLTAREYQILMMLVQAKGSVVSKREMLKTIWGGSFEANTNTIEVFINFLRNKIDKNFPNKLIKTRVGFGYYLEETEDEA